jgi:hypothetical protein
MRKQVHDQCSRQHPQQHAFLLFQHAGIKHTPAQENTPKSPPQGIPVDSHAILDD